MKSKQTKATDIQGAIKKIVWERDHQCCVMCASPYAFPDAHFVSRAHGGLGVEQNIVTLCRKCHAEYDNGADREWIGAQIEKYLKSKYPSWKKEDIIFRKGIHALQTER